MSDAAGLRAFVAELAAAGVRDAVVCPGSRSTPLALALRTAAGIRVRVLYDERAAAFFALGMARTSRRPVALLGTSGTAVVEFGPAVVEAQLSRVPLVVLTADRPPELRDRGAAQTVDQVHLYGRAAKWYAELPMLDGEPATIAHWRWVAGRAVAVAADAPAGPVHLNAPFREPLLPDGSLAGEAPRRAGVRGGGGGPAGARRRGDRWPGGAAGARAAGARRSPGRTTTSAFRTRSRRSRGRPAFRCSPIRCPGSGPGSHDRSLVVARGDQLARPGPWLDAHLPDLVIRTGAMPTSKPLLELLARVRPELLVLDGGAGYREAALIPATYVHADPAATLRAMAERLGDGTGGAARLDRGLARRRPRRDRGDGRLARGPRRAVRGRPLAGPRRGAPRRRGAVGLELDAGPGPGRLAPVDRSRDHGPREPRRQRHRRRRVDRAGVRGGGRAGRSRSWSATSPTSTTSTRWSRRGSTAWT